jgi:hypothetical protein
MLAGGRCQEAGEQSTRSGPGAVRKHRRGEARQQVFRSFLRDQRHSRRNRVVDCQPVGGSEIIRDNAERSL